MGHSESFLNLVDAARKNIKEYTVEDVKKKMEAGESFIFVDTREDREWQKSRAKGAIHLGKGVIERDIESAIPDKNAQVILYCGGGFRSAIAAESVQKMGYTDVSSMDGGFRGWLAAGLPTEEE